MNTKIKFYIRWVLFAVTALMILGFPFYHIYSYGKVLRLGTAYRIPCRPYDPYDPFSGRYVSINPEVDYPGSVRYGDENKWVQITKGEKGQLKVVGITETRPKEGDYLPVHFERDLRKFFMNENLAPVAERVTRNIRVRRSGDGLPCELEIKVFNGRAVSQELYINNIPIAEYCRQHQKP